MPNSLKFSGHQSFSFRNTWLPKGIQKLSEYPELFKKDDALVTLGVGKNMVSSIKFWCKAFQLIHTERINGKYQDIITEYGEKIFLNHRNFPWDQYLEDAGTLWLLHFLYTTNVNFAGTAYYVFNEYVGGEFTRNSLSHHLELWANRIGTRTSPNTIRRDVNTFIHTYAGSIYGTSDQKEIEDSLDCPFTELGLVSYIPGEDIFILEREDRSNLPDDIFLFGASNFFQSFNQTTVTFSELSYSPLSPGRIFRLDELSLTERLEKLEEMTSGRWTLSETAGMRQVLIRQQISPLEFLTRYYQAG